MSAWGAYQSKTAVSGPAGQCIEGFKKIAGDCIACVSFNWKVLLQALLLNCCTCLFLLHKSMRPVISAEEIK